MPVSPERPYKYEVLDEESAAIPVYYKGHWFVTIVDLEDAEYLSQFNWNLSPAGYATCNSKEGNLLMHRMILGLGKGDERKVDHINRLRAYNKKSNLRIADHAANMANRKMRKDNTSGYTGVYFIKSLNKWAAQVSHKSKKHVIAYCDTAIEAAKAYDIWVIAHRDEHASTNFERALYTEEVKHYINSKIFHDFNEDRIKDEKRMVTKETIMQIYQLHDSGLGYKRIAKELELPVTTVAYYFSGKSKKHSARIDVGRRSAAEDAD